MVPDATCAPQKISFPQDVNLLNEARENLKGIVDDPCRRFDYYIPRMYRRNARKDYLNPARCKKRTSKKIRKAIRQQLQYIRRDRKYINELMETECELTQKTKVMFSSQLLSGISKERGIIRNASWQIKSTGTETTLPIAGSTESAYQGRLWED